MTSILNNGYTVMNPIAGPSGIAVAGNADSGTISQYNNNQADTITPGDASKNGSIKSVIATDAVDTVNLGTGWSSAGTATDQTTGITGTLYTSSSGDQLLISGEAKVNLSGDSSGSSTNPTPTPASTTGQSTDPAKPVSKKNPPVPKPKVNNHFLSNYLDPTNLFKSSGSSGSSSSFHYNPAASFSSSVGDSYFVPSGLGDLGFD